MGMKKGKKEKGELALSVAGESFRQPLIRIRESRLA